VLVEGRAQARAPMARRAEGDLLVGVVRVGVTVAVRADEGIEVDAAFRPGGLSGAGVRHGVVLRVDVGGPGGASGGAVAGATVSPTSACWLPPSARSSDPGSGMSHTPESRGTVIDAAKGWPC